MFLDTKELACVSLPVRCPIAGGMTGPILVELPHSAFTAWGSPEDSRRCDRHKKVLFVKIVAGERLSSSFECSDCSFSGPHVGDDVARSASCLFCTAYDVYFHRERADL